VHCGNLCFKSVPLPQTGFGRHSGQNAVFVGDFSQSPPRIGNIRRLTPDERTNYPLAWTRDSRKVIFESNRRNGN